MTKFRILIFLATLFAYSQLWQPTVFAQSDGDQPLELRLRRDFGYGLGGQIQGRFSMKVDGPENLDRVEFYIDGQLIGEDSSSPFSLVFNTGDYDLGVHQLQAIGYPAEGPELRSNTVTRQFASGQNVVLIVVALVLLVVVFILASRYLTRAKRSGESRGYGFLGGAICPNCGRPYGIHWWSIRLGIGRMDRCSHCGKWKMVQRSSVEALTLAEQVEDGVEPADTPGKDHESSEDQRRRQLEESRYQDE